MTFQILIIGAGATGLSAANMLAEKGHHVTIVEARDRVGGRIHTLHNKFPIPIENGAEFIHGRQPSTFSLVGQARREVNILSGNRYQLFNGELQKGDFFDQQWEEMERALQDLKADTDIGSFLDEHFGADEYEGLREKVKGFVEGFDAADMQRASALSLREEWKESDDEKQYHITGGYSALMQYLQDKAERNGVKLFLSSPVKEIQWSAGNAKVLMSTGQMLTAEKVIITVPLGVLQNKSIRFTPGLPNHQRAFGQMGFGGVVKVFLFFEEAFWEKNIPRPLEDIAFVFSDAVIPTWWSQRPDRTPLLTGWLGGPSAREINHDTESIINAAIESLQYVFKCSQQHITREIREWHIADWVKDPYALGAYAYPTIQTRKAREFLSLPVKDTLYFAGEALYNGPAMGTVEAALVNGEEVAKKIGA